MNTPQSNQYTPIQLENIKEAAIDLLECLTDGKEDRFKSIYPVSWLEMLLKSCADPTVFNAIVAQQAAGTETDPDAVATMLFECNKIVEQGELAIQKALSTESNLPKEELSLTQTLRKIWGIKE